MIHNIRDAFTERLEHLDWMDEQTKKAAVEKVLGLNTNVLVTDTDDRVVMYGWTGSCC